MDAAYAAPQGSTVMEGLYRRGRRVVEGAVRSALGMNGRMRFRFYGSMPRLREWYAEGRALAGRLPTHQLADRMAGELLAEAETGHVDAAVMLDGLLDGFPFAPVMYLEHFSRNLESARKRREELLRQAGRNNPFYRAELQERVRFLAKKGADGPGGQPMTWI